MGDPIGHSGVGCNHFFLTSSNYTTSEWISFDPQAATHSKIVVQIHTPPTPLDPKFSLAKNLKKKKPLVRIVWYSWQGRSLADEREEERRFEQCYTIQMRH